MPAAPQIPPITPQFLKFASVHRMRGAVAVLRAHPHATVLLKQAKANMPRLQEQIETAIITEHEFSRLAEETALKLA